MPDNKPRPLSAVEETTSDPMTVPELQTHGNDLLIKAAKTARAALKASAQPEIIYESRSYGIYEIEKMARQADEARVLWQTVSGILAELVNEFHRAKYAAKRPGGGA